jgi:hypothetical protein
LAGYQKKQKESVAEYLAEYLKEHYQNDMLISAHVGVFILKSSTDECMKNLQTA